MSICLLRTGADPESMPLDLHATGPAPARNIQIEPNLTKQKCQFVCYGQVQTLWRPDPMACFGVRGQNTTFKKFYLDFADNMVPSVRHLSPHALSC
jgi:hypothetical protein